MIGDPTFLAPIPLKMDQKKKKKKNLDVLSSWINISTTFHKNVEFMSNHIGFGRRNRLEVG